MTCCLRIPGEQQNLTDVHPEVVARLAAERTRFYGTTETGWHALVKGGPTPSTIRVAFDSQTSPFSDTRIARGERPDRIREMNEHRTVEFVFELAANELDEAIVRTADPAAPVTLFLQTGESFRAFLGNASPVGAAGLRAGLDNTTGQFNRANPDRNEPGPWVSVWYEPPGDAPADINGMSEEEIAQLRSLGYLQ